MFCKYCGKQIDDDSVFCPYCGSRLSSSGTSQNIANSPAQYLEERKAEVVTDKWIWSLATLPIVVVWIASALLGISSIFAMVISIGLNIAFITLDVKEVKSSGMDIDSWMYLGFILVPVYLFVRESKTNRNYIPCIVWCVLFVLDILI